MIPVPRESGLSPADLQVRGLLASTPPGAGAGRYLMRSGDNLAAIAKRFGVSVKDLKRWNGLRTSRITAGDHLIVSPNAPRARRNAAGGGGL